MEPSGAWLAVLESQTLEAGSVVHVPAGTSPFVIGRSKTNALCLQDEGCARRHAALEEGPDGLVVVDYGSTNGTEVNGERVARARLFAGDRVRIATTLLAFYPDETHARGALRAEITARRERIDRIAARAEHVRSLGRTLELAPEHLLRTTEWIARARADEAPLALLVAGVDEGERGDALADAIRGRYVFTMRLTDEHAGILLRLAPDEVAAEAESIRELAELTVGATVSVGVGSIAKASDAHALVGAAFASLALALASGGGRVGIPRKSSGD